MTDQEYSRTHPITSHEFARQLAELGVIATADNTERITVTAAVGQPLTIRVDQFGDNRLARAVADAKPETVERYMSELSTENARLRELGREIVSMFAQVSDGYRARVGQVQIQHWLDELGADHG